MKVKNDSEKGKITVKIYYLNKNGSKVPYFLKGKLLKIDNKESTIGPGIDISYRKAIEEQAVQLKKMEVIEHLAGRFTGSIAHDLNNLLTGISGFSELIYGSLDEADPIKKDIGEIQKAAQSAASLVQQLLTYSQR